MKTTENEWPMFIIVLHVAFHFLPKIQYNFNLEVPMVTSNDIVTASLNKPSAADFV